MERDSLDADAAAMARLKDGEDLALNEIMSRWQQPLANFIFRVVHHEQDAAELAQMTFVRVYESRASYRPTARFSTWLFTIATNLSRNHLRWRLRHPALAPQATAPLVDETERLAGKTPDARQQLESKELGEAIRQAVEELPAEWRVALVLSEYEDKTQDEIAAITGGTRKSIESRLYRARQELRNKLKGWL